jgi:hypothetical protein
MRKSGGSQFMPRDLTGEIAYLAARLIAEDGMTNVGAAKQKAARQMGIAERGLLPDDHEIESALRSHQAIFQNDSQPQECHVLRRAAVDVMRWLDRFSPWLVGGVLSGSANRFSRVELEIVTGDPKRLEMFLFNEGAQFETRIERDTRMRPNHTRNDILIYEISFRDCPITIACYHDHASRSAHRPRESLKHARAQLMDVEVLLAD